MLRRTSRVQIWLALLAQRPDGGHLDDLAGQERPEVGEDEDDEGPDEKQDDERASPTFRVTVEMNMPRLRKKAT